MQLLLFTFILKTNQSLALQYCYNITNRKLKTTLLRHIKSTCLQIFSENMISTFTPFRKILHRNTHRCFLGILTHDSNSEISFFFFFLCANTSKCGKKMISCLFFNKLIRQYGCNKLHKS